jgi:hypothetical protein
LKKWTKKAKILHFIHNILLFTPSGPACGCSPNGTSCARRAKSFLHFLSKTEFGKACAVVFF